jgi:hypothetical protein
MTKTKATGKINLIEDAIVIRMSLSCLAHSLAGLQKGGVKNTETCAQVGNPSTPVTGVTALHTLPYDYISSSIIQDGHAVSVV